MHKNLSILMAGLVVLLTLIGLAGCGSPSPSPNQATNSSATNANSASVSRSRDVCKSPLTNRPRDVRAKILEEMSEKLRKQHEDKVFQIEADVRDMYVVVYIEGLVHGSDELKNLANKINDFGEDGCVKKVVFVPQGSIAKGTYKTDPGFEWTSCPYPYFPCPDGTCGCRKDGNSNVSSPVTNSNTSNSNVSAVNSSSSNTNSR